MSASFGLVLALAATASAQQAIDVHFARGKSSAVVEGTIQGDQYKDYRLTASAGQVMTVSMKTGHGAAYFNVLPPGSEDVADFIGSTSGNTFEAKLAASGTYTVRVYLMRSAARRGETASYSLDVAIAGHAGHATGGAPASDAKVNGTPYHATGQVPCSMGDAPARSAQCTFGVIRGGAGRAELHVTPPGGFERVLRFASDKVSCEGAKVVATRTGDEWSVVVDDYEHYDIPDAVVSGD